MQIRTLKQKIKQSINSLSAVYLSGGINYPRIDNNFGAKDTCLDLFPHAPLPRLQYSPINKKKKIIINKESIILYLSYFRVITPSQIESVFDYIDYYLDDLLLAKNDALRVEAETIISLLKEYLSSKGLTSSKFLSLRGSFYRTAYKKGQESYLISQKKGLFISLSDNNRVACESLVKSRINDKNGLFVDNKIHSFENVTSALHYFREKNKNMLENSEKENIIYEESKTKLQSGVN